MAHPLKGRKQDPATIAKRIATMKAKRAMREQGKTTVIVANQSRRKNALTMPEPGDIHDAVLTLKRFRKIAMRSNPDPEDLELLGRLALRMLEGGLK